jgi:eukaryotic-like serine/threonine-protein kinase
MPTTLSDRYQLHELVGSGAAGRVYRARDLRLGRDVAVKRLRADALGGVETRARFAREAYALARVSDPNVLAVFDVSAEEDDSYLVTDFCPDGSLADRLRLGALTPVEVRDLARDVSAGLVAMHAAGIVHRDIKPSNILRLGGRWVIGDLGIARVDGAAPLTQTGAVIGTPDYWAPETARGAEPTRAVDMYGLGCVLFEALSGRPPFRGDSPLATGLLHTSAAPPPLPNGIQTEDPALAELVMALLAKDPAARPTAATLNRGLGSAGADEPADTLRYPAVATGAVTAPALPPTVAYPPGLVRRRRRPRRRALLAAGALILAGTLAALVISRDDGSPGPAATTSSNGAPTTSSRATPVASSSRLVPRLEGLTVAAATAALTRRGLELTIGGTTSSPSPPGSIVSQVPPADGRVPSGSTVSVTVSNGPAPPATVPSGPTAKGPGKPKPANDHGHGHGKDHGPKAK